jgi:hypothetical protein
MAVPLESGGADAVVHAPVPPRTGGRCNSRPDGSGCVGAEQLHFPGERDRTPAAMLSQNRGDPGDRRFASPVTLEFGHHDARGDRHCACLGDPLHGHVMRLACRSAGGVGDHVDGIAVVQRLNGRHGHTDLRPQARDDQLLSTSRLDCVDDATVFPSVDEGPVDGLLIGEYVRIDDDFI